MAQKPTAKTMSYATKALTNFNNTTGNSFSFGNLWNTRENAPQYLTYFNEYFFPTIEGIYNHNMKLGNKWYHRADTRRNPGIVKQNNAILDNYPHDLNLNENRINILKANYSNVANILYPQGVWRTAEVTLSTLYEQNFSTFGDAVNFYGVQIENMFNGIDIVDENEVTAMIVKYATSAPLNPEQVINVSSFDEAVTQAGIAFRNFMSKSSKYNETINMIKQSDPTFKGLRTIQSDPEDIYFLTTDDFAASYLIPYVSQAYNVKGLDLSSHIISYPSLDGWYQTTADITITSQDSVDWFRAMGNKVVELNDVIPSGTLYVWDVTELEEFVIDTNLEEIKADTDYFCFAFDINNLDYVFDGSALQQPPFINSYFSESNHVARYYTAKNFLPFYNKKLIH